METTPVPRSDEAEADNASSEAMGQKLISTPPLLHVMKYMVPSVLVLVTLKYQAKTVSPFLENPAPLWCFLAATCVYWLILGAMKQITNMNDKHVFRTLLNKAALSSGALSAHSLVSIFLPYPVSLVPLLIWTPLPLVLARPILYHAYTLLKRGIKAIINKIQSAIVVWADRGLNSTEEASNLPAV